MKYFLGFDIGGTKCAAALGCVNDKKGTLTLLAKEKFATADRKPYDVLEKLCDTAKHLLEENELDFADISASGISCGGPLDSKRGIILSPPNLPGWDRIDAVRFFEEKTGIKTFLQNDANACAVAEWKFGAGRGCSDMIFLTFGTGLGAGLILDSKLYSGASDMAGEIGHVRLSADVGGFLPVGYGKRGSAEGFCSGAGLAQLGRNAAENAIASGIEPPLYIAAGRNTENITAKLIAELASRGDAMCVSLYEECGKKLGSVLAILIDLLNPQKIIIGGIFMRSPQLLLPAMKSVLESESLGYALNVCEIVQAGLGEAVGDYAALSLAAVGCGAV